jgi:hypothetical protein
MTPKAQYRLMAPGHMTSLVPFQLTHKRGTCAEPGEEMNALSPQPNHASDTPTLNTLMAASNSLLAKNLEAYIQEARKGKGGQG